MISLHCWSLTGVAARSGNWHYPWHRPLTEEHGSAYSQAQRRLTKGLTPRGNGQGGHGSLWGPRTKTEGKTTAELQGSSLAEARPRSDLGFKWVAPHYPHVEGWHHDIPICIPGEPLQFKHVAWQEAHSATMRRKSFHSRDPYAASSHPP